MASAILATSTVLQFLAAFLALRLVRITRHRTAWFLIAAAVLLMAFRRSITLVRIASGDLTRVADPAAETVALIISVLMVVGVARIAPLFSELQRSAAEISKSQRQLRDILDHTPAAVYVKDRAGRFILANKQVVDALGVTAGAVGGQTNFDVLPNEVAEEMSRNDVRVLEERRPIEFDESLPHRDGSIHHYLSVKFPLFDADGQVYGICGISTDITERLQLETEQRAFQSKLEEAQRLESLGMLAGGIAHDFNNLLVAILGGADLAQSHPSVPAEVKEDLESVIMASRAAAALCNQLLVYAGKGMLQTTAVDLSALVNEMCRLMEVSVSNKGLFECRLDEALPPIEGDPSQLQQVIMNLVANAADALVDASGKVTVATYRVTVSPDELSNLQVGEGLESGEYVCFEVRDTGGGMNEETRRRLFEPFYTTKFTGRGLGLATVAGLVRSHRGGISVDSEPGAGTAFRVYFPVARGVAVPSPMRLEAEAHEAHGPARGTILVVDDDRAIREVATKALERSGFRVCTAENGREALETFSQNRGEIALVVMDLTMPEMGGYQAFFELRRIDPSVQVLLSSGYDKASMERERIAEGLAGFIQKPYKAQELVEAVHHAIGSGPSLA